MQVELHCVHKGLPNAPVAITFEAGSNATNIKPNLTLDYNNIQTPHAKVVKPYLLYELDNFKQCSSLTDLLMKLQFSQFLYKLHKS